MPKNVSLFMDYCKVIPPQLEQISLWSDSLTIIPQSSDEIRSARMMGLEVTLEATHSAFFNDNMRFYIPSRMEDGARSFVNGNKPAKILKHHDSASDPVGIVIDAEYIPTVPEVLRTNRDVQILTDSTFSVKRQISAAKRLMKTGMPFSDDWRGLGYIQLKAIIFDKKTISQVNNGLFDAVSTSFVSPGQVYCSICATNLAVDGFCEHEPGNKYEDSNKDEVTCALIPGIHRYKECSLVVFDADPLTAIEIGVNDSKNNNKKYQVPLDYWKNNSLTNDSKSAYEFKDFKEENIMGNKQVKLSDAQQEVFDFVAKLRPDMEDELKTEFTKKITALKDNEGNYPDQVEAGLDLETYVLYAIENLETADQKIDADAIYAEMEKDLQEDTKLSAEKRKGLGKSTFCGPNKSFPVPDCAHVTAARRLIDRYKGPGDKSNILACVARKAKALGCENKNKDSVKTKEDIKPEVKFELPDCDQLATLSDKEAKELFNLIENEVVTRQLKFSRPCGKCASSEDSLKTAQEEAKQLKSEIKDKENTLRVLRAELKLQIQDCFSQIDHQILLDTQLKTAKQDILALMSVLSGKFKTVKEANDSLKDMNLEQEEAVINDNFKLDDILEKLNNGMSNQNPKGTVDNPTINHDKDNTQLPTLVPQAIAAIRNIKDFVANGNIKRAKLLYDRMVAKKYFSTEDVPFDSLSVEDTTE